MINYRLGDVTFSVFPFSSSLLFLYRNKTQGQTWKTHRLPYLSAERSSPLRIIPEGSASLPLPLSLALVWVFDEEAADSPDFLPVTCNFLTKKMVPNLTVDLVAAITFLLINDLFFFWWFCSPWALPDTGVLENHIIECFSNEKENHPGILLNSRFCPIGLVWTWNSAFLKISQLMLLVYSPNCEGEKTWAFWVSKFCVAKPETITSSLMNSRVIKRTETYNKNKRL